MVNNNLMKKAVAGASIAAVTVALTVSGAFGKFIVTDFITGPDTTPYGFGYGYGYDDNTMDYDYGYGYGYGKKTTPGSGSTSNSSGGGSSSGGGLLLPNNNGTPNGNDNKIDNQPDVTEGTTTGYGSLATCANHEFKDVTSNWAKGYINTLGRASIVNGVTECVFQPNRNVTRVEFLKMSLRAFGYTYSSADAQSENFSDVADGTWESNVVGKAKSMGIVDGVSTTMFKPNDSITRAEAMKMLLNTAATKNAIFKVDANVNTSRYTDLGDTWQAKFLEKGTDLGLVNGDRDANGNLTNTFRPNDSITRAESAKVVARSMEAK